MGRKQPMPTADSVKAKIRAAAAHSREALRDLDLATIEQLQALYAAASEEIRHDLLRYADAKGNVKAEVLDLLLAQINDKLKHLSAQRTALLNNGLESAAALGAGVFSSSVITGVGVQVDITRLADDAVAFVRGFIAADGLQLSDRLWLLDVHAREAVGQAIQQAVILGTDASLAADDFLRRGVPIPPDIAAALGLNQAERIALEVSGALLSKQGNPYANALRVFRTELNRAHGSAYLAGLRGNPDVAGVRFMLSPRHPRPDICDLHASANLHGLGKGVYPLDNHPWPAHPNTFSYLEAVFWDEVTPEDRAAAQSKADWLRQQPIDVQVGVLGSRARFEDFQAGRLNSEVVL